MDYVDRLNCSKCFERALDASEMATKIAEVIINNFELSKYAGDALIRNFVYFSKKSGWDLERISNEVLIGIKYYYENERT